MNLRRAGLKLAGGLGALVLVVGCGGERIAAHLTAGGVDVTVRWRGTTAHRALAVTFSPQQAGFRLYGLEAASVVGVPTRVELGAGLVADGAPGADATVQLEPVAGDAKPVPVFPAGPVTVTVPVTLPATPIGSAQLWVSYAACNDSLCLQPVRRQSLIVATPDA